MSSWKSFDYSYLSNQADLGYRPYLEVKVEINDLSLNLFAIIDSGCQDTLISTELAPLFNFELKKSAGKVGGVGGDGKPGYGTTATLTFPQMNSAKIESPVVFTDFPADMLLGQCNFFHNFEILFKGREGTFSLRKIKNFADER